MAGGEGKRKKKEKRRKKREGAAAPAPLRIDFHVHFPALASGRDRQHGWQEPPPEPVGTPTATTSGATTPAVSAPAVSAPAAAPPAAMAPATPEPVPDPDPVGPEHVPKAQTAGPTWPVGPHYLRWVEGKGSDAWARFKLKAADWYLSALESAEAEVGLDRYVGVEMAIDGVLASLLAGVDAAGHALLDELGRVAGPSGRPSEVPGGEWSAALELAEELGIDLACRRAVDKAVVGDETEERDGWLTDLRRLQRLAVRRNVLVRRPSVDGTGRSRLLDVPGVGQRPVLRHLGRARQRAEALVEAILADVETLEEERLRPGRQGVGRGRTLPNLAARADVVPSHWRSQEGR